jgi:GMP synthase PP-ATPase subunit
LRSFYQGSAGRNQKLGIPSDALLAQGTLYTDLIESGKGLEQSACNKIPS